MPQARPALVVSIAPSSRSAWTLVGLLWCAFLLNYVDRQVVFSIFPALERDLGFSSVTLALIGTVFIWTYAVGIFIAGRLADLLPRSPLVCASLVLWSVAIWGTAQSHSVNEFLVWRGAMGLTEALYFPAAAALIAGGHGHATRSRALAVHQSAQLIGGALGGWYGGWAADHAGWRLGLSALAGAGVLYALILVVSLRMIKIPPRPPRVRGEASPQDALRSPSLRILTAAFFCFCGMLWMIYAWLPHHIYQRYGLSMTESGLAATLYLQVSTLAGMIVGGYLGDQRGRRRAAGAGLIACPIFGYLVFAAPTLGFTIASAIGFGLTAGLFQANVFALAYEWVAERNYGFTAGLLNGMGGLAGGLGILVAGAYRDNFGVASTVAVAAGATTIFALWLLRQKRNAHL